MVTYVRQDSTTGERSEQEDHTMSSSAATSAAATGTTGRTMEKVYEIYIRTTPEQLWEAITDPKLRAVYNFGGAIESDWTPGSRFVMTNPGSSEPLGEGENLEVDPPRRLVQTMRALWGEDVKAEGFSRITWEIEPI